MEVEIAVGVMELTERQKKIYKGELCPYCGEKPELVDSAIVYGRSYGKIWLCKKDKAFVGVHKGTEIPLGRLANANLRMAKRKAHDAFDKIWQSGRMKRKEAYAWLSDKLGTPKDFTHIGMFGEETCKKVIELCATL